MPRATRHTPEPTRASPSAPSKAGKSTQTSSPATKGKQRAAVEESPPARRKSSRRSARQGSAKSSNLDPDERAHSSAPPSARPSFSPLDHDPTPDPDPSHHPSSSASSSSKLELPISANQNAIAPPLDHAPAPASREDSPLTDLESSVNSPAKQALLDSQDHDSAISKPPQTSNGTPPVAVVVAAVTTTQAGTPTTDTAPLTISDHDQSMSPASPVIPALLASAPATHSTPSSPADLGTFDKPTEPNEPVVTAPIASIHGAFGTVVTNGVGTHGKEEIRHDLVAAQERIEAKETDRTEDTDHETHLETASDAGTVVENEHEMLQQDITFESVDLDEPTEEAEARTPTTSTPFLTRPPIPLPSAPPPLSTANGSDISALSTIEEDTVQAHDEPISSTSAPPIAPTLPIASTSSAPILRIDTSAAAAASPATTTDTPMGLGMPAKEVRMRFNGYKIMAVLALNVDLIRLAHEWQSHRAQHIDGYQELTARLASNLHYLAAMAQQAKRSDALSPPPAPILDAPADDILRKRLAQSYTNLKGYFVASERFEQQTQLRNTPISLLPPPASPHLRTLPPSVHHRALSVPASTAVDAAAPPTRSTRSQSRAQSPTKTESERAAAVYRRDSLNSDMAQEHGVAREQERLQALGDINIDVTNGPPVQLRGPAKRDRSQSFPVEQYEDGSAAKRANIDSAPSPATSQIAGSPRYGGPAVDNSRASIAHQPLSSPATPQIPMQQLAYARQQQMTGMTQQQQAMLAQQYLVAQRQAQSAERQRQSSANAESPRLVNSIPVLKRPGSALGHSYSSAPSPAFAAASPTAQQVAPPTPVPFHVDSRSLADQFSFLQAVMNAPNFSGHPASLQQQVRLNAQRILHQMQAEAISNSRMPQNAPPPPPSAPSPMAPAASPRHLPSPQLQQNQFQRNSNYAGSAASYAGSPSASGNAGATPQAESSSSFFREQLAQQETALRAQSPATIPQPSPHPSYSQPPPNYASPGMQANSPQQIHAHPQQPIIGQPGPLAHYAAQHHQLDQRSPPAFVNASPRMPSGTLGGQSPVLSVNGRASPALSSASGRGRMVPQRAQDTVEGRGRAEEQAQIYAQNQALAQYQAAEAQRSRQAAMMQQQQQQALFHQQEQYRLAQQHQMRQQMHQQQMMQQRPDPRYGYALPPQMQQQRYQPQPQPPPPMIPNPFGAPQQPSFARPPPPPTPRQLSQQSQQQFLPPQEYPPNEPVEEPPAWDLFINN